MNELNLTGSIDLMRLQSVGTMKVPTRDGGEKHCVVIPIDENEIFISKDDMTGKTKAAYLGININQRREVGERGATHYAKPSISKKFAEKYPAIAEERRKSYCGDFKPYVFDNGNAANTVIAERVERNENDDLPF